MNNKRLFDFLVVVGVIAASVPIILVFKTKPLTSALLFFLLPTVYLFLRGKKPIGRIFAGTLLLGVGLGLSFDLILVANNAWIIPSSQMLIPYRILGSWPVDEPIWFFLWSLFILVFYEHFYDRERTGKVSKHFRQLATPLFIILTCILYLFIDKTNLLEIGYAYFLLAIPSLIPIVYVIKNYPSLFLKFLKTGVFFFLLYLVYEITALKLGQWYFPGQYIGWVEFAGTRFPLEELFFWMIFGSITMLSLYEGFVDDRK